MSKIYLAGKHSRDVIIGDLLEKFSRKVEVYPPGTCPLTVQLSLLHASMNQTCGKCVPCRDGLPQLAKLLEKILNGVGSMEMLDEMKEIAIMIRDSADCAIGYQSAIEVLEGLETFASEYESHIRAHECPQNVGQKVPCVTLCPAHVDIPGYIAHVHEGNYAEAINLIRRDNPLPTACAMICEHPCEERCRRNLIDDSINIRGIKKYAVDQIAADQVAVPKANVSTGKKVAVKYNTNVGVDISVEEVRNSHDAMFVAIGAQKGKKLRLENIDANNVFSAVEMLDEIGHGHRPDYTGKTVAVIGGGNVAMDAARSALRCGAKDVRIVYRRRQEDMTALDTEIESAVMEGIELMLLQAPKSIEKDENGDCCALWVQPQMIGAYRGGRPSPVDSASKEPLRVPCDVVLIAVGQDIISEPFEAFGMPAEWHVFQAGLDTAVEGMPGVFVGGDCATGPATAIKAIAAGKVAAHNIDEYLGYHHTLNCGVEAPEARENNRVPTGRVNIGERPAYERKHDFEHVECPMTHEEAMQESGRCLRCDVFGCGKLQDAIDK